MLSRGLVLSLAAASVLAGAAAWWLSARRAQAHAPVASPWTVPSPERAGPTAWAQRAQAEVRPESEVAEQGGDAEAGASGVAQVGRGRLVGRIYGLDGEPAPRHSVCVTRASDEFFPKQWVAAADRDAFYEVAGIEPGSYDVGLRDARASDGFTIVGSVRLESDSTTAFDIVLAGTRSISGAYSFATSWEEMDFSVMRLELFRADRPGRVVARANTFTDHSQPWSSGVFRFAALPPDVYVLRRHPFLEPEPYFDERIDLTHADAELAWRQADQSLCWRERAPVEAPDEGRLDDTPPPAARR